MEWALRDKRNIALISDVRIFPEVQLGGKEELFPHIRIGEVICCSVGGTFTGNQAESWQDIRAGSNGETWIQDTGYSGTARKTFLFA